MAVPTASILHTFPPFFRLIISSPSLLLRFCSVMLSGTLRLVNDWLVVSVLRLTGLCSLMAALSSGLLTFSCAALLWCGLFSPGGGGPEHTVLFLSKKTPHTAGRKVNPANQVDHFICLCFPWGVGHASDRIELCSPEANRRSAPLPRSLFNSCVTACAAWCPPAHV